MKRHMEAIERVGLLLACIVFVVVAKRAGADEPKANRFESSIRQFEENDKESPPRERPIVFVGSSSIRRWNVTKAFPDLNVINRGFGGSQIPDSVLFCERIVTRYNPPIVVFYAGDNDIAGGKSAEQVAAAYWQFAGKVRASLPETQIIFISIKPSVARWARIDTIRKANALVKEFVKLDRLQTYLDVEPSTLGADGKPRPELFVADGLHPSDAGYEEWNKLLRPLIEKKN